MLKNEWIRIDFGHRLSSAWREEFIYQQFFKVVKLLVLEAERRSSSNRITKAFSFNCSACNYSVCVRFAIIYWWLAELIRVNIVSKSHLHLVELRTQIQSSSIIAIFITIYIETFILFSFKRRPIDG